MIHPSDLGDDPDGDCEGYDGGYGEPSELRPWCEWCGTNHRDSLITAECQRLREDCDGFTRE